MKNSKNIKQHLREMPTYKVSEKVLALLQELEITMNTVTGTDRDVVMASVLLGARESENPLLRHIGTMASLAFVTTGTEKDILSSPVARACSILDAAEIEEKVVQS